MEEKWILTNDGVLIHHGIEGQKWGQRNGPPYPLDSSQASAAEKKKGFSVSKWTGGLTKAEKKANKQFYKDNKKEYSDNEWKYSREYYKTEKGRAQKKEYRKASNDYFNVLRDDDSKQEARFLKAQESMLRGEYEYVARQMSKTYSDTYLNVMENRGVYRKGYDYYQSKSDEWKYHTV